ncbi:hypothetical protein [Ottowia sp.]|uniref:hypothetical protein n=1 Tax=Ottowia sp. TaxID=1898956 RepID=UPI0039E4AAC7
MNLLASLRYLSARAEHQHFGRAALALRDTGAWKGAACHPRWRPASVSTPVINS